jgi:diguanylate cyclase (GGDEF)-like protein
MQSLKWIRQRSRVSPDAPGLRRKPSAALPTTRRTVVSTLAVACILCAIAFNTVLATRQAREQNQALQALQTSGQVKRDLDQLQQMMLDEHGDLYTAVSTRPFYNRAHYAFPIISVLALTAEARSLCAEETGCVARFNDLDSMIRKLADRSDAIARRVASNPGSVKLDDPALGEIDAYFYSVLESVVNIRISVDGSIDTTVSQTSTYTKRVSLALFLSAFVAAALLIALLLWNARIAARLTRKQKQLTYQATFDTLTALPNRAYLQKRLNTLISNARDASTDLSVLFVDLDRFKQVNDSLGHAFGDALLAELGLRLKGAAGNGNLVGRYGGDEFLIIAKHNDPEQILDLLSRIFEAMGKPVHINDHELFIEVSVGISTFPTDGSDADALIRNADAAMYLAKSEGRNGHRFYRAELSRTAAGKLHLSMRLRRAVIDNLLTVVYQPQVNMVTGKMVGVEALLRWRDDELGVVSPAVFIQTAEDTGVIHRLGEQVLRQACEQARGWYDAGLGQVKLSVNVSPVQLAHANFLNIVQTVLSETNWPPEMLELEVTEGALMRNVDEVARVLLELRALGVKIAIDDFGTGYSSLSYLKRFSIDRIKIDRVFVQQIGVDSDYEALTVAIIAIANALKFDVIAEGVEREAQKNFLVGQGCVDCQGFLYSPGVSPENITRILLTNSKRIAPENLTDLSSAY